MKVCAICNRRFEAEDPAVLYVGKYGNARVLCEDCEALLDAASDEGDLELRAQAREALAELSRRMDDPEAMAVLRDVLDGKLSAEETEEDITDELAFKESIEEEEEEEKKESPIWDYLTVGVVIAAVVGFALWFFLR